MIKYSEFLRKTIKPLLWLIVFAGLCFQSVEAQEVTQEEIERSSVIRSKLIQQGYLYPNGEIDLPQLNAQFLLEDAWYTEKKLNSVTLSSRATHFSPDGLKFYILGRDERHIAEYHLDDAWQINTAEYIRELDIEPEMSQTEDRPTAPHGMYIRDDGEKLWVLNRTEIWEYTLSEPWNITTAEPEVRQDLIDNVVRGHDFEFKPDGSVLYIDDRVLGTVFQYNLAEAWDVTSLSLDYVLDISDQQQAVRGTNIRENGTKMFLMDTSRREVLEYNISTPYDLRTATYSGAFSVASESVSPEGLYVKPGARIFYVTANFDNQVHQYKISEIDLAQSIAEVTSDVVEANRSDFSEVRVFVKDDDGDPFVGVEVELTFEEGEPIVQEVENITDENGLARFRLRNDIAELVRTEATVERNGEIFIVPNELEILFVPPAPIILSATEEGTTRFTANWEFVEIASSYAIDVAEDPEFESIVRDLQGFNVGNVTNYTVENLMPGQTYFYRIKAFSNGIEGNQSESREVNLFPETPIAETPGNVAATNFTASWSEAEGSQSYFIDVSRSENFMTFIESFESKNVGDNTEVKVVNLSPGTTYYYRVRSSSVNRITEASNAVSVTTRVVDLEKSQINAEQRRVLANGEQQNRINIRLLSPDGGPIEGESMELTPVGGSSVIEAIQSVTDENGRAQFSVTNTVAETVTYNVSISGTLDLGDVDVEFLQASTELVLGANFPNPFQSLTYIPINVPETTKVKLVLSNSFGRQIQTILDEQLNEGYYEIPVDLTGLASGTYFYRLITEQKKDTRKMMFVK